MKTYDNIPDSTAKFIIAEYKRGESVTITANQLGIHPSSIYRLLARRGIPRTPRAHWKHPPASKQIVACAREMYCKGVDINKIADELKISARSIRRWTERFRSKQKADQIQDPTPTLPTIQIRSENTIHLTEDANKAIIDDYLDKKSVDFIAEKYGISRKTVYNKICAYRRGHGLPIRHPVRPKPIQQIPVENQPYLDEKEHAEWMEKIKKAKALKQKRIDAAKRGEKWAL